SLHAALPIYRGCASAESGRNRTSFSTLSASQKTPPVSAVRGGFPDDPSLRKQVEPVEALAQFPGLGVAQEDRIPQIQGNRSLVADGRLDLAGAFQREQAGSLRQVRHRQFVAAGGAGGHVTASRAGVDAGTGPADDLDGETRGGLVPEIPVIIEQDRSIKSRPHGHLRHRRVPGGGGEASRPASVDEAEGDSQLAD